MALCRIHATLLDSIGTTGLHATEPGLPASTFALQLVKVQHAQNMASVGLPWRTGLQVVGVPATKNANSQQAVGCCARTFSLNAHASSCRRAHCTSSALHAWDAYAPMKCEPAVGAHAQGLDPCADVLFEPADGLVSLQASI